MSERDVLIRHLREAHPNLLGAGHDTMFGRSSLPEDLTQVPTGWLLAVHDANHAGLYRDHRDDDWLTREGGNA